MNKIFWNPFKCLNFDSLVSFVKLSDDWWGKKKFKMHTRYTLIQFIKIKMSLYTIYTWLQNFLIKILIFALLSSFMIILLSKLIFNFKWIHLELKKILLKLNFFNTSFWFIIDRFHLHCTIHLKILIKNNYCQILKITLKIKTRIKLANLKLQILH